MLFRSQAVLGRAGEPTQPIEWADLRDADPDVLALMPCGFTIEETRRDLHYLTGQPGWNDLSAVQTQQVALLDGNAYFNRPGPRLYRAIEVLASVLYSEQLHPDPSVADWERQWLQATESSPV